MAVILDIRNPSDLTSTYNTIEIQRGTLADASDMANITTTLAIDTTTASDLSTGYTSYTDSSGTVDVSYYRFRFKASGSGAVSSYSDVFLAGGTVIHNRFRRMMRDTNSNNYFFNSTDLDFFLDQSVSRLWPITWFETYSDTAFVPDGTTKIFTFPIGVTRVNDLDFIDSNGNNVGKTDKWRVRNKTIVFESAPPSGYTIRAWVEKRFVKLSEIPEIWDSHILNIMRLQAYEMLEADRSIYYKYNSIANPEGGNLPLISKIIERIESQIKLRENQLRRVRAPGTMNLA